MKRKIKENIILILKQYINNVSFEMGKKSISEKAMVILMLAEFKQLLNEDMAFEIGYSLCKNLKQEIEHGKKISIIDKRYIVSSVQEFSQKFNELHSFSLSLNTYYYDASRNFLKMILTQPINFYSYDVISGISGQLFYFLNLKNKKNEHNKKLLEYLCFLFEENPNREVINAVIDLDLVLLKGKQQYYKDGYLNLGFAHGILGPLVALSKAFQTEEIVENRQSIKNKIDKVLKIYEEFERMDKNISEWPFKIPIEEYLRKNYIIKDSVPKMASWCNGNLGIAAGLYQVYKNMDCHEKMEQYSKKLWNIINRPICKYNLTQINLCHGYASVLSVLLMLIRDKRLVNSCSDVKMVEIVTVILNKFDLSYYQNVSFLDGGSGVVLSLGSCLLEDTNYQKLLLLK